MKNKSLIYALLAVIAALAAYLVITSLGASSTTSDQQSSAQLQFQPIVTGTTDPGDVSIELTPTNIDDKKLEVSIAVNTHSVDLNQFNLEEITTLEYNGKTIKPSSAPSLNGHHSSGIIIFDTEARITSFTIKIKNIPNIQERTFKWE